VVAHALEKDPNQRYQTADEFLRDLRIVRSELESPGATIAGTVSLTASRPSRRKLLHWGVAGAALAAAIAVAFVPGLRPPFGRSVPSQKQIAVIPFENVNANDPVNQAFCDGLVQTLTTALTELQQFHGSLMVVPASEVRRQGVTTPSEARKAFHVNLAITGSIQRMADQIRITTNLADAQNGPQLGARTIVSRVQDINELQDRVVRDVASLLDVELQKNASDLLAAGKTSSAGAYDLYLQARGYLERFDKPGNLDRAVKLLEAALSKDARYALAWSALSQANWLQYRATKDAKWLERAQENGLRAIEIDPRIPSAHVNLGLVFTDLGRYPEAVAECEAALKLDSVSVEALRALASAYERSGKISEAEDVYKKALRLREGDWLTWSYLGVFYRTHGRYQDAEKPFRRVAELTPDNSVAYMNLGILYVSMGRYEDARPQLEHAIQLKPSMAAYSALASVYYFQGAWHDAVRVNEKALALVPTGSPAPYYVYGNLADAYRWTPDLKAKAAEYYRLAIDDIDRSLATNPRNGFALACRGVYRSKLGDTAAGESDAEAARSIAPSDVDVIYFWALIQELSGHRQKALGGVAEALKRGYSLVEIQHEPELADLRRDPLFQKIAAKNGVH
jgi:tetratricopeptide (TPR) repeat protein